MKLRPDFEGITTLRPSHSNFTPLMKLRPDFEGITTMAMRVKSKPFFRDETET